MHIKLTFITTVLLLCIQPAQATIRVFSCEPEWAALSQEIGGNKLKAYSATTAFQDVHRIQARPSLIAKMRKADLVICTGAELEAGWLPLLIQRAANPKVKPGQPGYFMAADQIERIGIPEILDRAHGDVHPGGNPHIHLDPHRIATIAQALTFRLTEIDPDNTQHYQNRLQNFTNRWQSALKNWQTIAKPLKGQTVVTHHEDWLYLLQWLGIKIIATLEEKPGIPPTASHLAALKKQIEKQPPAMILRTEYQDARPSEWLATQTGIPAITLPYTVGGNEQANDLFTLFEQTLTIMLKTIQK